MKPHEIALIIAAFLALLDLQVAIMRMAPPDVGPAIMAGVM